MGHKLCLWDLSHWWREAGNAHSCLAGEKRYDFTNHMVYEMILGVTVLKEQKRKNKPPGQMLC